MPQICNRLSTVASPCSLTPSRMEHPDPLLSFPCPTHDFILCPIPPGTSWKPVGYSTREADSQTGDFPISLAGHLLCPPPSALTKIFLFQLSSSHILLSQSLTLAGIAWKPSSQAYQISNQRSFLLQQMGANTEQSDIMGRGRELQTLRPKWDANEMNTKKQDSLNQ